VDNPIDHIMTSKYTPNILRWSGFESFGGLEKLGGGLLVLPLVNLLVVSVIVKYLNKYT